MTHFSADHLKTQARAAGLSLARYAVAAILACVGIGFLTAAVWRALADHLSAVEASVIVGSVFLALSSAIIVFQFGTSKPKAPKPSTPDPMRGFLTGMEIGHSVGRVFAQKRRAD